MNQNPVGMFFLYEYPAPVKPTVPNLTHVQSGDSSSEQFAIGVSENINSDSKQASDGSSLSYHGIE